MTLKEFLENICIDDEWKIQYYTSNNADIVVVFDTAKDDAVTETEEELVEKYGNRRVESMFIDTVKRYGRGREYPQIVLEIEE